jgi:hypothetical protein
MDENGTTGAIGCRAVFPTFVVAAVSQKWEMVDITNQ